MIPETTRGTFGAFRDPGPTCPQARCESHVIRAPFSAKERDSGSVYTYDTPPEKSHVMSRGQFSSTSTNVVIPTIPPQYSKGLRENYMRHLWETMSGSGNSGTGGGTNALPHPHPPHDQPHPSYPTGTPASSPSVLPTFTNLHATHGYITLPGPHQTPQPRPPSDLPKSPKPTEAHTSQTNPTGPATSTPTPRTPCCPAHTRRPDLASASLMRSKRRPPHPKHSKFTQFHRSGLHFGRTPYNWKHVEGDTMDAHTIYTIAAHAHSHHRCEQH